MAKLMKQYFPLWLFLLVLVLPLFVYSCGDSTSESTKTIVGISVLPAAATVEVGASQTFTAYVDYSDGTTGTVVATWSLSGEVGTVIRVGYSGLFVASAEGSGTVSAAYDSHTGTAAITVSGSTTNEVATIEVTPADAEMRVGDTQTFYATGTNISGESVDIAPAWSLNGDSIGILSYSGTYATLEVSAEGTASVLCISGEVTGEAVVTVEGFVITITVETDTYVDKANPSVSYGDAVSLKAGYVDSSEQYETYLYFPLDDIPAGASIESATIKVYPSSAGDSTLQLKKLTSAFTGTTTWGARPTVSTYLLGKSFSSGSYNSINSNELNDLVAAWLTGTTTNYGVAIVQEGTATGTVVILSLQNGANYPIMEVQYTQ